MKKSRLLSIIISLALAAVMTGCSTANEQSTTASEASVTSVTISASESISSLTEAPETVPDETAETTAVGVSETVEKLSGLRFVPGTGTLSDEPDEPVRRKANSVNQIVGTMYDGTAVNSNFYYYRCVLNSAGKTAYDTIHAGLLTGAKTIKLTNSLSISNVDLVYYSVLYDDPQIVWAEPGYTYTYNNSGYVVSISPTYNKLVKDIAGAKKALENSVSKALAVMWKLPNNIERSKYAHDYLTHTIDYVENDLDQNAYSALVQHKTVCAGYSQAFSYMMQKMGAPCAVVIGNAGEDHAWNIVMLNGESYVTDVTWDDPVGNPPNKYYYDYFNITSRQMSRDHTLESPSTYLAAATGTYASYNNYFRGNAYGTNFNNPTVIGGNTTTTAVTTKPPVTTTKPQTTTTRPHTTTDFNWDDFWNDDWWDDDWYTTTKPQTTANYDWDDYWDDDYWDDDYWDDYWDDDWWDDYGFDDNNNWNNNNNNNNNNWNWNNNNWWNNYNYNYNWSQGKTKSIKSDDADDGSAEETPDLGSILYDYTVDTEDAATAGWWSFLDPYWEKEDWTDNGDGHFSIEDSETGEVYMYDESDGSYRCKDPDGKVYLYDKDTDEWKAE